MIYPGEVWEVTLIKEGAFVFDADGLSEEDAVEAARAAWARDENHEHELWEPTVMTVIKRKG